MRTTDENPMGSHWIPDAVGVEEGIQGELNNKPRRADTNTTFGGAYCDALSLHNVFSLW